MYRDPCLKFWAVDPSERVNIRLDSVGAAAEEPVSIPTVFQTTAEKFPTHPALVHQDHRTKEWKTTTYSDYLHHVNRAAKAFIKIGLQPHHSVGIVASNCPEWFIAELAAIHAGGLAAGIYTTNSADAVCHILKKSRANIVVVEDERLMDTIRTIRAQLPLLRAVVQINGAIRQKEPGSYSWADLTQMNVDDADQEYRLRLSAITPNQSATLIFTSGTVGMPKGVLLSHDNNTWMAKQTENYFQSQLKGREVLVSYLPLSHVAAQCVDIFFAITNAATVYFADRDALKGSLINTLRKARPTRFLGVPRVFEKLQEKVQAETKDASYLQRYLLRWARFYTLQHHMNNIQGKPTKTWHYLVARNTNLKRMKQFLGLDRCESLLVGAAPTDREVKEFFLQLDLPLLELYGMSELSGPTVFNDSSAFRLDSVGKMMPGAYLKIFNQDPLTGQGEVVVKGRQVFMGYIDELEKTQEVLDEDGWMHTGDLGYVDKAGFLFITGRIKELVITSGGENVPPVHVEQLVKAQLPCVSNAFLVGDQRKYLTMLLTLKTEMDPSTGAPRDELQEETKQWLKGIGVTYQTLSELLEAGPCPKVQSAISAGIVRANKNAISNAQKVQKFTILDHDFSVATGELGPTLKVKRSSVNAKYSNVIDKMCE